MYTDKQALINLLMGFYTTLSEDELLEAIEDLLKLLSTEDLVDVVKMEGI